MNLLRFSLLLTFLSCYASAELDAAREAAFQRASKRYSNPTPLSTPTDTCSEDAPPPPPERGQSVDLRTSRVAVRIEDEFYWNTNDLDDDQSLTINNAHQTWQEISSSNFNYGQTIHKNIFQEISKNNGNHIITVNSSVTAEENDLYGESLRATHRFESKFEDTKILYVGNIQFNDFYHNIDSTVSIINTQDFDPCLLEQSAAATLKYHQNELLSQGRLDFNINCMITKNLTGELNASFIFTNKGGEILRKVDLSGELTLKVSEALSLKYSAEYIKGTDPIDNFTFESFSTDVNRRRGNFNIAQFYFTKRELNEGKLHKFSLLHTENLENCSKTRALSVGGIEDLYSEGPLFYVSQSKDCTTIDPNTGEEILKSTGFSLSNFYLYNGQPSPILSFNHSIQAEGDFTSFGLSAASIAPDPLSGERQTIFEFDFNKEEVKPNGRLQERALKVVYSQNESYLVAEQIIVTPIIDTQALLQLQTPKATRCGETPEPNARLTDPDLCQKINCLELGAGLTFTNQGGVFLTTRGKTIADIWGRDFEVELIAGLPLNSRGVNRSWGQVHSYYSRGFSGSNSSSNNDQPFISLSITPEGCDSFNGEFCTELNLRSEKDNNQLGIGGVLKF